jgi:chorismate mutase / prephenate dehydratase
MDRAAPDPLMAIRNRIDAVDEAMHRLLVDRSSVIAELIRIKGTSKPGAAFRPDREADMMRRIAMRHTGDLPLATVEHIWREIITTFTAMQAPFGVTAGPARDPLAMRDLVRFYFGFSIPVEQARTNGGAILSVARSRKAVAVIAAAAKDRWWRSLAGAHAPKVFAKLPFIEIPDRPADLAAYVIGPPLRQDFTPDIRLFAVRNSRRLKKAAASLGGAVAARADDEALVELPVAAGIDELLAAAGLSPRAAREVGGFFQPIEFVAERVA